MGSTLSRGLELAFFLFFFLIVCTSQHKYVPICKKMPWMFKCWDISKNRIHAVLFKTKLKYENNICVSTPSNLQRQTQIKKQNKKKSPETKLHLGRSLYLTPLVDCGTHRYPVRRHPWSSMSPVGHSKQNYHISKDSKATTVRPPFSCD